jgi:hypothetical protein
MTIACASYTCSYNGSIGTCAHCHQPRQWLRGGLCLACRQDAERRRPRTRRTYRECAATGCHEPAQGKSAYCPTCQERRRKAYYQNYNRIRRWERRKK